jgi:hypothetical protein
LVCGALNSNKFKVSRDLPASKPNIRSGFGLGL